MKNWLAGSLLALTFLTALACGPTGSPGEKLFRSARQLERSADYFKALADYKRAQRLLLQEGKAPLADQCRYAVTRLKSIALSYPHDAAALRRIIKQSYPGTTDTRIAALIRDGRLPHLKIGGRTYYFADFTNTLYHIYPDFRTREEAGSLGKITKLFTVMAPYIYPKTAPPPGETLVTPLSYLAEGELVMPRGKLPKKGLLKVWLPLPLTTAAQPDVEIVSLEPRDYVKYSLKRDGDIGLAYLELPLEQLSGDLKLGLKVKFRHFTERFKINPRKVGRYDRESELYRRYTASYKNTAVTPAILATAKKLAGSETNPYLIARKFYDHIVHDLDYSYTPHGALDALAVPESVYVHEHGYGDCGAQSMYFAALCRALGIPARSAGGYQLFPGSKTGAGCHFWAQFYLPNYGWVPVDTSVGQLAKYMPGLSAKQRQDHSNYFFGNLDPFRYLIQVDVDVPLVPPPDEPLVFSAVLQQPTALCRAMGENPGFYFMDNWQFKARPIKGVK
jgi:transglutaminase-like putative cysteine protease